jgi:hypothetical protein
MEYEIWCCNGQQWAKRMVGEGQQKQDIASSWFCMILVQAIYEQSLIDHTRKKIKLTDTSFQAIEWVSYRRAFQQLLCRTQFHTSKLIKGCGNTNHQNNLYYCSTSLWPCCNKTFLCVLQYHSTLVPSFWDASVSKGTAFNSLNPEQVIEAILYGFSEWLDGPVPPHTQAYTP